MLCSKNDDVNLVSQGGLWMFLVTCAATLVMHYLDFKKEGWFKPLSVEAPKILFN